MVVPRTGSWVAAVLPDESATTPEVDLGGEFEKVQVYSPAIDSATLTVKVARNKGDTAVQVHAMDDDATGDFVHTTTAKTAAAMNIFTICARYITLVTGANQTTAAVTFYVRGIDPL